MLPQIEIYNSLVKKTESFHPIRGREVGIYVCGVTVYDDCHLGHARMLVVFDTVVRYLRERGYDVTYVRNITDIDDKIIRRASETHREWRSLTETYITRLHEDEEALGVARPDFEPRATDNIPQIVSMIEKLVHLGYAYQGASGDVYFSVDRFPQYGALSGHQLDQLWAGARVALGEGKNSPLDFVLWKSAKQGEPSWASPWGPGRPGWHIECSAMSVSALGPHFDIHGGGLDLKFPHHENEIAQSQATTGQQFVNFWMHNGFVEVGSEKMAKSAGNFATVRELLAKWPGETLRYLVLASHYRSPLAYTEDKLAEAHSALSRLYLTIRATESTLSHSNSNQRDGVYSARFHRAMSADFNTPEAIAVLFDCAHEINRLREVEQTEMLSARLEELKQMAKVLGLLQADADQFLKLRVGGGSELTDDMINRLVESRSEARKTGDYKAADEIRVRLANAGIILEDTADGTLWRKD